MTLQHAKAIKTVLSLRCQKEKNMKKKKKNVHAVMLREIKSGNVQVGNIWLHMIRYSHLIMSIYHETNSSFSFVKKETYKKKMMEWIEEFLQLSECSLFNIHIDVD